MQPHNYFLVLFKKDADGLPKPQGQKPISKEQYEQFCSDIFKEFSTGNTIWLIQERRIFEIAEQRRIFEKEDSIAINCFVIIDAKIKYIK